MFPKYLDLSNEECIAIQRRIELECYALLINTIRVQGPLTEEGKKFLKIFQEAFGISTERHKAEVRRAVNDEELTTVADKLYGEDTSHDWVLEGRRLVPPLQRRAPLTVYTALADQAAAAQTQLNAEMPNPQDTGSHKLAQTGLGSTVAALNQALSLEQEYKAVPDLKDVQLPEDVDVENLQKQPRSDVRLPTTQHPPIKGAVTTTRQDPSPGSLHTRTALAHHKHTATAVQRHSLPQSSAAFASAAATNPVRTAGMMRLAGPRVRTPVSVEAPPLVGQSPRQATVRAPQQQNAPRSIPNILLASRSPPGARLRSAAPAQPQAGTSPRPVPPQAARTVRAVQPMGAQTLQRPSSAAVQSPHMIQFRSAAKPTGTTLQTLKDEPKTMRLVAKSMPGSKVGPGGVVVMTSPAGKSGEGSGVLSSTRILNLPAGTRLVPASAAGAKTVSGQPGVVTISPRGLQLATKTGVKPGTKTNVIVVHKTQGGRQTLVQKGAKVASVPAASLGAAPVVSSSSAVQQTAGKSAAAGAGQGSAPGPVVQAKHGSTTSAVVQESFQKDFLTFIDAKPSTEGGASAQAQADSQEPEAPSVYEEAPADAQAVSALLDMQSGAASNQESSQGLTLSVSSSQSQDSDFQSTYTIDQMAELLSSEGDLPLGGEGDVVYLQQDAAQLRAPVSTTVSGKTPLTSNQSTMKVGIKRVLPSTERESWTTLVIQMLVDLLYWKPFGHVESEPLPAQWFMEEGALPITNAADVKKLTVNLSDVHSKLQTGFFQDLKDFEASMSDVYKEVRELYPTGHPAYHAGDLLFSHYQQELLVLKNQLDQVAKRPRL